MDNDKFVVVLGLDSDKKPHAARFNRSDEATVCKAAAAKGFKIGLVKTKEAADLVAKLPEGKLFDSGRGMVPFVAKDLYEKLLTSLEITEGPPAPNEAPAPLAPKAASADPWSAIRVGTTVLAFDPEPGPERSWWPCKVVEVSQDQKILAVRWTQYPKLAPFRVKKSAVGILPPKS